MGKGTSDIIQIVLVIGLVVASLYLGWICHKNNSQGLINRKRIPSSEQEIIDDCANRTLKEAVSCLRDNINSFYFYRKNVDNNYLNFAEIKESGGDCKDWSELYNRLGEGLGFYSTLAPFPISEERGHVVSIISNATEFCVLDQRVIIGCGELKDG